jgi:(1->4)-alpha-D-glucan 1-alpha-D-glucosylmutase
MVTLSTHDTKRSEDVRARIGVLSQVPGLWNELTGRWALATPSPDAPTVQFLLQNMFGVWPPDGVVTDQFRERLHNYAEKAMREAAVHTSWHQPNEEFEAAVHRWLDDVVDGPVGVELTGLVKRLVGDGWCDALGQKLLSLTVPGVPDVYQGTEILDDSLVDPDNRRPVDYARRREALSANNDAKMGVVAAALRLRRRRPDTFLSGGYTPVLAEGASAEHVVAFLRGDAVLVAVTRYTVRSETGLDAFLTLPAGQWTDAITGRRYSGRLDVSDLFNLTPVVLLEKTDD